VTVIVYTFILPNHNGAVAPRLAPEEVASLAEIFEDESAWGAICSHDPLGQDDYYTYLLTQDQMFSFLRALRAYRDKTVLDDEKQPLSFTDVLTYRSEKEMFDLLIKHFEHSLIS
jgi:hypothetical protein